MNRVLSLVVALAVVLMVSSVEARGFRRARGGCANGSCGMTTTVMSPQLMSPSVAKATQSESAASPQVVEKQAPAPVAEEEVIESPSDQPQASVADGRRNRTARVRLLRRFR